MTTTTTPTETIAIRLNAGRPWPHWGQALQPTSKAGQEALDAVLRRLGLALMDEWEQDQTMLSDQLEALLGGYQADSHDSRWRWLETLPEAQPTSGDTLSEQLGQPCWEPPTWMAALDGAAIAVTFAVGQGRERASAQPSRLSTAGAS